MMSPRCRETDAALRRQSHGSVAVVTLAPARLTPHALLVALGGITEADYTCTHLRRAISVARVLGASLGSGRVDAVFTTREILGVGPAARVHTAMIVPVPTDRYGVALLVWTPEPIDFHRILPVNVIPVEETAEAVGVLRALLRQILARKVKVDVAYGITCVLVADTSGIRRCDAVHCNVLRPAGLLGRIVERAFVVTVVSAKFLGWLGHVARWHSGQRSSRSWCNQ